MPSASLISEPIYEKAFPYNNHARKIKDKDRSIIVWVKGVNYHALAMRSTIRSGNQFEVEFLGVKDDSYG